MIHREPLEPLLKEGMDLALRVQGTGLSDEAEAYLVMRLAHLDRWAGIFAGNATLAGLFLESRNMGWTAGRQALQAVGDMGLLIASAPNWQSAFGARRGKRPLGTAYFMGTGKGAYDSLAPASPFEELAGKFRQVASALTQVWTSLSLRGDVDLLATYAHWLATDSPFLGGELLGKGVVLSTPERLSPS